MTTGYRIVIFLFGVFFLHDFGLNQLVSYLNLNIRDSVVFVHRKLVNTFKRVLKLIGVLLFKKDRGCGVEDVY